MSVHWAIECLAEDRRRNATGRLDGHEPFGRRQLELVSNLFVDENLRLRRIELWTDIRRVQEMNSHRAGRIDNRSILRAFGEVDARDG